MSSKIKPEHLQRLAVIYVRQSSVTQTVDHVEGKRRQYALAESASQLGFASVETIDDDMGRSASGLVERPGFERLVAVVCSGTAGAVFCLEASRLARNGRDWHHLIDLCALVGVLLIDPEGVYDPRLMNDRLLLGLKGTMSEYELSLLRQRGVAARESLAKRGELCFRLPPGFCWNELGRIEFDPNERVRETIGLIFRKFKELGSVRQVHMWSKSGSVQFPVLRQRVRGVHLDWKVPAYHNILCLLKNPMYAGVYAFGRTEYRVQVMQGRARKTGGHKKSRDRWSVLLPDHHAGYISWEEFERNQVLMSENAHKYEHRSRKSARGGSALLSGMLRCGRCGRMMRVVYRGSTRKHHRYYCRGDERGPAGSLCMGVGGTRVDKTVAEQLLQVVEPHAVDAALEALQRSVAGQADLRRAAMHELEQAQYEADLAARRYEAVDPAQRLVARELEARWEAALARVRQTQQKLEAHDATKEATAPVDRTRLLELAGSLERVWNAPTADMRIKQRVVGVLVEEVLVDIDEDSSEVLVVIHWKGGRHSEVRWARVGACHPSAERPNAIEVLQRLGGKWTDIQLAVTMNRMGCRIEGGGTWTTVRIRELRERLGIPPFDLSAAGPAMITADEAARRLSIGITSLHKLIRRGVLPATQLMPLAPWQVPVAALDTEAVRIGVQQIIERRPLRYARNAENHTPYLPGYQ